MVFGYFSAAIGRAYFPATSEFASGTLTIALVPGYETIGLFAPIVVVLGRLCRVSDGDRAGGCAYGGLLAVVQSGHDGRRIDARHSHLSRAENYTIL